MQICIPCIRTFKLFETFKTFETFKLFETLKLSKHLKHWHFETFNSFQTLKLSNVTSLRRGTWSLKLLQSLKVWSFESLKVPKFECLKFWNVGKFELWKFQVCACVKISPTLLRFLTCFFVLARRSSFSTSYYITLLSQKRIENYSAKNTIN